MPRFGVWCEITTSFLGPRATWLKHANGHIAKYDTREQAQFAADQQNIRSRYKTQTPIRYTVKPLPTAYSEADICP